MLENVGVYIMIKLMKHEKICLLHISCLDYIPVVTSIFKHICSFENYDSFKEKEIIFFYRKDNYLLQF